MPSEQLPEINPEKGTWDEGAMSRRQFLKAGVLTTTSAAALIIGGSATRFLVGDSLESAEGQWVNLGQLQTLPAGAVHKILINYNSQDAWRTVQRTGILYAYSDDGIEYTVLDATCTHLGCLVRWQQESNHFACPCHEGLFTRAGEVISGAPTKPLCRLTTRTENDTLQALI